MNRYPDTPGSKVGGTSAAAAASMRPDASGLRQRVLAQVAIRSLTADEAAAVLNESILAIRPRFSELREMNKIHDSGTRRKNESGRSAIVWKLSAPSGFLF